MGKLTAFLIGTFLLLVLAYSELASSFSPLINWLGPVFGVPLQFLFGLTFMMVGNPIAYPSVLIAWVVVGVVVGLLVRRTGRAILSAFLAYAAGWLFLILTGIIVFYRLFPSGILSSLSTLSTGVSVPPAPPGTDIATILHEPLLNGLPSLFATITSGEGALNSITADWVSILLSCVGNFFILLLVAGLTSSIFGKASKKLGRRMSERSLKVTPRKLVVPILLLILFQPGIFLGNTSSPVNSNSPHSLGTMNSGAPRTTETKATTMLAADPSTPQFKLEVSPQSQSLAITGSVLFIVNVTPSNGFDSAVVLSFSVPKGTSCSFNQFQTANGVPPLSGQNCHLTLTDFSSPARLYVYAISSSSKSGYQVPAEGKYNLVLNADSGSQNQLQYLALTIVGMEGVKNVLTMSGFDGSSQGAMCPFSLVSSVYLQNCFSIQQNFFVENVTASERRDYWAQNVLILGKDSTGNVFATSEFNIFEVVGSSFDLVACTGGVVGGICLGPSWSLNQIPSSGAQLSLSSVISGNLLTIQSDFRSFQYVLPPAVYYISNLSSYIYLPQLDVVGDCCSHKGTFSTQTSGSVQSFVQFIDEPWSDSVSAIPLSTSSTGETSVNLQWSVPQGSNTAAFSYQSSGTVQGVGFEPGQTVPSPTMSNCVTGDSNDKYSSENLDYGLVTTNLWNLEQGDGNLQLCNDPSGLHTGIHLDNIQYSNPNGGPAGYPEVGYGENQFGRPFGTIADSLSFPMKIDEFSRLGYWASATYTIGSAFPSNLPLDFAYDLWLEQSSCTRGQSYAPQSNDLEVMLWLYGSNNVPAGTKEGEFSDTVRINGLSLSSSWVIYSGTGGSNTNDVSFVLQNPPQLYPTTIDVRLQDFVSEAFSYTTNQGSNFENYCIAGVEMGTEFGKQGYSSATWEMSLSNYDLYNSTNRVSLIPSRIALPPIVEGTGPSVGSGYGNSSVSILGSGFLGATSVIFGSSNPSESFKVVSDSLIQAVVPPGVGIVDVVVTTPFGESTIEPGDQFTYASVVSFSPASGPKSGGTLVTFIGHGFATPMSVMFGKSEATSVNVISSTAMAAISPAGTGTVPVIVTDGDSVGNIPILGSGVFTYGTNVSPPYYLESVLGEVNPDGSVTSFYSFLTNSATQSHLFNPNSNEAFMLLFSQSGGLSLLPSSLSGSFSSYTSFIPQTMVFIAYTNGCSDSQAQANTAITSIATIIRAPDLSLIVSFPLYNIETSAGPSSQACGFLYGSGTPLSAVGPVVANDVLPSVSQTGIINTLKDGLTSGYLIPEATSTSVNATVLVAGFGSASALSNSLQFILPSNEASIPSPTGLIGFAGAVTLHLSVVHSSSSVHNVSLGQLLDYQRPVSFANSSTLSVAGIGVPPPGSASSTWTDLAPNDQLTLYTNNPSAAGSFGSQTTTSVLYSGQSISSSGIQTSFTGLFPADLMIHKAFTQVSGGNVQVSVSVRNLDTSPVTLTSENDGSFLNSYSSGVSPVSGTAINGSSVVLKPNDSMSYRYTVHLSGIGSYYSTPASVTYLLNGTGFTGESNVAVWQQAAPEAPQAIFSLLDSTADLINPVVGPPVVYALILALVALAALSEYRSFRRWGQITPQTAKKLEELKKIAESGLITEKEYEEQRKRLEG